MEPDPPAIDVKKVFEKNKKPLAGLDTSKSLRPKRSIKKGSRGKFTRPLIFDLFWRETNFSNRFWPEANRSDDSWLGKHVVGS